MCTACVFPKGTSITEDEFDNCWESNQDGGGFVYIDENGKFVVLKSLSLDDLKEKWKLHHAKHGEYSPFLLHFRAASQGDVTLKNCHPFLPNPRTAFIHNGTIYKIPSTKEKSDTRVFSEEFLSKLPHNFLANKSIMTMMDDFLGKSNKLAFLDINGNVSITNLDDWKLHNEAIYSNDFFKNIRVKKMGYDPTGFGFPYQDADKCSIPKQMLPQPKSSDYVKKISEVSNTIECNGCFFIFQRSSQMWDFQKNLCIDCVSEISSIEKKLRVSNWRAKEIFLEAARRHPKEAFFEKLSVGDLEEAQEKDAENPKEDNQKFSVLDTDAYAESIMAKELQYITEAEWAYLYDNGYMENDVSWMS